MLCLYQNSCFRNYFRILKLLKYKYCSKFSNSYVQRLMNTCRELIIDKSHPNGIGILAMNFRASRNSLSDNLMLELFEAVESLSEDETLRALIVCSSVPGVFCLGTDVYESSDCTDSEVTSLVERIKALYDNLSSLPMPTIAAIDGAALGGGLEMALSCDLRYAGVLPSTKLGLVGSHWSLLPGAGGSQRLPRLIGPSRAKELMFCARPMSAQESEQYGVVNAAVHPSRVDAVWESSPALGRAFEVANEIAANGPLAVRQIKRAVDEGLAASSFEEALMIERDCYARIVPSNDRREGMKAFAEKRQPVYKGE